jgi:hypothetical protein
MSENLEERFYDALLRTLNYSIEFVNDSSYASLRFMDLFTTLLKLQPLMSMPRNEFYESLREKIKDRELVREPKERAKLQTELSQMFIEEWRRRDSQK